MSAAASSSQNFNPSPPKKPQPPAPWSHLETIHLIQTYQEKWYSLNRGQLKASQWEEVSTSVASRCGFDSPSKTATQCRHKIEKLRKRYRAEKQRPSSSSKSVSPWPFFEHMDLMERPLSTRESDTTTSDDEEDLNENQNNTRSISHILNRPPVIENSFPRFSRNPRFRKRSFFDRQEEEEEECKDFDASLTDLASVVREFGEGFVRIENMKMEIMREVERVRMEMEMKRMEMILESQERIADAIAKAFWKKAKEEEI
ncbi:trihelix transcription factor ENAP1-like [Tasmannia lanceolata]|uniref:trihelix transcription factor ENAP1-like n=1 Tax=Tasmannia lanceolata TaxID=3420 RepID=UPI004062A441